MNQPSTEQAINEVTRQAQAKSSSPQSAEPKRRKRWLLRLVVVIALLVVAFIALAPLLLSTGPGTAFVVSLINDRVDGELEIDELDLRWGAGQSVQGLTYSDSVKGVDLSVRMIDAADLSLWAMITGSRDFGNISLLQVDMVYTQPESKPNQQTDKSEAKQKQQIALPPGLKGALIFTDLTVEYVAIDQEPAVLTMPTGSVQMPDLRDISFDLQATLQQGLREGGLQVTGGVLNLFDPDGVAQPVKASYQIDAEVRGLSTRVVDSLASGFGVEPGLVAELLGEGDLLATAKANGTIEQMQAKLKAKSKHLDLDLIQERDGDSLIASPKSSARLRLTPQAFAKLFKNSTLKLVNDEVIVMQSLQFRLPNGEEGIDLDQSSVLVRIAAQDAVVLQDRSEELVVIEELKVRGGAESIAKRIVFEVSATLAAVDVDAPAKTTREPVRAELVVNNALDKETREIVFFSERLPIHLADALGGQEGRLVLWLGETLALRVDLRSELMTDEAGKKRFVQSYSLLPEGRVNGEVVGLLEKNRYTLGTKDKTPIQAELVPEAFASLMEMLSGRPGEPLLTIEKPMPVFVTLRDEERGELSIVTDPDRQGTKRFYPDPDRTYLGATITLSPARVYDPAQDKTYELRGGKLKLSAPDLRGKAEVEADLQLWVRPDAGSEGIPALLKWETTVADILDTNGSVPLDPAELMKQVALQGGVKLENAPSGLFDSLLNRDGDISSILGPIVQDLAAGFTYKDGKPKSASVKLNWDAKNKQPIGGAWASMNPVEFDLDNNQMLTVRGGKDIQLEVKVTESFGDRWMGKLHPILFDAKSADGPVRIKIDGKSFRFPLNDPSMKGAQVNAEVDLGSVEFGNDALLSKLMQWSGRPGERAVFGPAKVALVDGKIQYDKFDLSVGNVQLRLDGEVDLASGNIVQMAVRVPGKSLTKIFSELKGIIGPDDYLSIPMTGTIRKPEFDRQLIVREVARLAARGLINKQKEKLGDKLFKNIFKDLGVPEQAPVEDQPAEEKPAAKPKPVEEQVRDQLIDRGLGLIFGEKKDNSKNQGDQPNKKPAE